MTKSVWQSGSVWLIRWFHGTFQVYFCLCVIKITFWMKLYLLWSPNVQSFDYFLTLTRQHYPCNQMVAGMQNPTFLHFDCYQMDIREHKYLHCENIRQIFTVQRNIQVYILALNLNYERYDAHSKNRTNLPIFIRTFYFQIDIKAHWPDHSDQQKMQRISKSLSK